MRKTLSDKGIAALKPRAQRYAVPDPELRGHWIRVQPSGAKSYVTVTRTPQGKQIWTTIGRCDVLTIAEAREKAREAIKRVRAGKSAIEEQPDTFRAVAENFMVRHVRAQGLISASEIERSLRTYVLPVWGDRPFIEVRRADIAKLLDQIEDKNGPRMADLVLAILRKMANWQEARDDNYVSPYRRGMRRTSGAARARARILSDDEIRAVWNAAETGGAFGRFLQLCLLTAQRKDKIVTMRWSDVTFDGTWIIPVADREKGTAGELVLPPAALEIMRAQPRMGENPYVFAGRAGGPFNGFSKAKAAFDRKLPADMPKWIIHDVRRTARSLMSRAGVLSEHAERVMGHAIAGVEGVYDRHGYKDEKADALRRLAMLIESIVHPSANVVAMTGRKKRR